MTDELAKPYGEGSYIEEFVSAGPKNYGFRVKSTRDGRNDHYVVKIRGFSLSYQTAKVLNFGSMKRMVQGFQQKGENEKNRVNETKIRRERDRRVVTKETKKDYSVVYDKRVLLPNYKTLPFGHKLLH